MCSHLPCLASGDVKVMFGFPYDLITRRSSSRPSENRHADTLAIEDAMPSSAGKWGPKANQTKGLIQ
jgi:hypothetical protein